MALKRTYLHLEDLKDQKLTQTCLPGWAVMSPRSAGLAETLIWTAVGDEVDWDQKSPGREGGRERETRSGRRAIKALYWNMHLMSI